MKYEGIAIAVKSLYRTPGLSEFLDKITHSVAHEMGFLFDRELQVVIGTVYLT
jgi:hypothetical protein